MKKKKISKKLILLYIVLVLSINSTVLAAPSSQPSNTTFIIFILKIILIFAAAMVPMTLGDKLAQSMGRKIDNMTKNTKKRQYARSKLGSTMAARGKFKEGEAITRAQERMATGGFLTKATGYHKLSEKYGDTKVGQAFGLMSTDQRTAAKAMVMKTLEQRAEREDKDALINRLKQYSHPILDKEGKPVMKALEENGKPVLDANGNQIHVPYMRFNPKANPKLARKFDNDFYAHAALAELDNRNLANDNVTAKEQFIDDLNGYQIGRNNSDGLQAAGKTGPHQHWNVNALMTNAGPTMGMGGSKIKKASTEDVRKWESGWVDKFGNNIAEIRSLGDQHGYNAPLFSSLNNETKQMEYYSPEQTIDTLRTNMQKRFGTKGSVDDDFKLGKDTSPRVVDGYNKLITNKNTKTLFTEDQISYIQSKLNTYRNEGGAPQPFYPVAPPPGRNNPGGGQNPPPTGGGGNVIQFPPGGRRGQGRGGGTAA